MDRFALKRQSQLSIVAILLYYFVVVLSSIYFECFRIPNYLLVSAATFMLFFKIKFVFFSFYKSMTHVAPNCLIKRIHTSQTCTERKTIRVCNRAIFTTL